MLQKGIHTRRTHIADVETGTGTLSRRKAPANQPFLKCPRTPGMARAERQERENARQAAGRKLGLAACCLLAWWLER